MSQIATPVDPEAVRRHVGALPVDWDNVLSLFPRSKKDPQHLITAATILTAHKAFMDEIRDKLRVEFRRPAGQTREGELVIHATRLATVLNVSSWNMSQLKTRGRIIGAEEFPPKPQARPVHTWDQIEAFLGTECTDVADDRTRSPLWEPFLVWLQDHGILPYPDGVPQQDEDEIIG